MLLQVQKPLIPSDREKVWCVSHSNFMEIKIILYLVQHNKDIIKNADVVPVGTTIKIPELSPKADKK